MPRINSYDPQFDLKQVFASNAEKKEQEQLYHMVEIGIPNDPVTNAANLPLKLVDSNYDVVYDCEGAAWDGNITTVGNFTYTRFPLKFTPADVNSDGSISKASVAIANVTKEIMGYVEYYNGLRGQRVQVRTAYAPSLYYSYSFGVGGAVVQTVNPAYNVAACMHDEYLIDNYSANETTISFQLDPVIDLEVRLPRRRYMVDSCYWELSTTGNPNDTCGYTGTDTECNKTLAACRLKGNSARFGGFPGISGSRRIFL